MSFEDKSLQCSDCNTSFTFTADEQEFYDNKAFYIEPKRCSQCHKESKANRSVN